MPRKTPFYSFLLTAALGTLSPAALAEEPEEPTGAFAMGAIETSYHPGAPLQLRGWAFLDAPLGNGVVGLSLFTLVSGNVNDPSDTYTSIFGGPAWRLGPVNLYTSAGIDAVGGELGWRATAYVYYQTGQGGPVWWRIFAGAEYGSSGYHYYASSDLVTRPGFFVRAFAQRGDMVGGGLGWHTLHLQAWAAAGWDPEGRTPGLVTGLVIVP